MNKNKKTYVIFFCAIGIIVLGIVLLRGNGAENIEAANNSISSSTTGQQLENNEEGIKADFGKTSDSSIKLTWEAVEAVYAYRIMRAETSEESWGFLEEIKPGVTEYYDHLNNSDPNQFWYRVDAVRSDGTILEGVPLLASNISICVDPGHYAYASELDATNPYGYDEGTYMLKVGLSLARILHDNYGISTHLTRTTDHITVAGFSDGELDNYHISLRGELAADDDLFISLHSNSNLENANGRRTEDQPLTISKPLILVNQVAIGSSECLIQASEIGKELARANYENGLSSTEMFDMVQQQKELREWDDDFNDSLSVPGTVCFRTGSNGDDYYGVLRGAAVVGVPGYIIEHAHHSVEEVRKKCFESAIYETWASADARGIARGYHFISAEK